MMNTGLFSQHSGGKAACAAVDIVVRFKDSSSTLPGVLEALSRQTFRDYRIIGVDSGSRDESAELIRAAGGEVIPWNEAYSHPRVLNFGFRHCTADLVLALSSHTSLTRETTLREMVEAMKEPQVACASGKWDGDPYYSDAVDWQELETKGMKLGSIYSNSMGMLRRAFWMDLPFDETVGYAEDYDWAVKQVKRGRICRRLDFPFDYQRTRHGRSHPVSLAIFQIARAAGLKVVWLGPKHTLRKIFSLAIRRIAPGSRAAALKHEQDDHRGKLAAWWDSRGR